MPAPLDNLFCEVFADLVVTSPKTAFIHYLYPYQTVDSLKSESDELVRLPAESPLKYKACYFVALTEFLQTKDMASKLGKVKLHQLSGLDPFLHILPYSDCWMHSEKGFGTVLQDCLLFPAPKWHPSFMILCTDHRLFSALLWASLSEIFFKVLQIPFESIVRLPVHNLYLAASSQFVTGIPASTCFSCIQSLHLPEVKMSIDLANHCSVFDAEVRGSILSVDKGDRKHGTMGSPPFPLSLFSVYSYRRMDCEYLYVI